jgi:hypothetical protein
MGSCASGGHKDTEVDLFLTKHHKVNHITTDKNSYEVSKQQFDPKMHNLKAKRVADDF